MPPFAKRPICRRYLARPPGLKELRSSTARAIARTASLSHQRRKGGAGCRIPWPISGSRFGGADLLVEPDRGPVFAGRKDAHRRVEVPQLRRVEGGLEVVVEALRDRVGD